MRKLSLTGPGRVALLGLALSAVGCGPGKGDVAGNVTFKGRDLGYGVITFYSDVGKKDVFSGEVVNGKYSLTGVTAGPCKVTVEVAPPRSMIAATSMPKGLTMGPGLKAGTEDEAAKAEKEKKGKAKLKGPPPGAVSTPIPEKYKSLEATDLTFTVVKGQPNKFDIDLKP